jgi:hypothetical protein
MNRQIKRALGTVAALSLGFAGFVGAAAPAQADASTTFKIHLNVPSSQTAQWNIWFWGLAADLNSDKANNTFGASTVGGVTFDRTPNFSNEFS